MANMIKLPYEDGGNLALNVDGAYDVTLASTSRLDVDYSVFSAVAGQHIQVQLTFTDATLDQGDANALLAAIKKASQAPNSQPTFPADGSNTIAATSGIVVASV